MTASIPLYIKSCVQAKFLENASDIIVVGERVYMTELKGRILYTERRRIMTMVSCVDTIVSLNTWMIESGDLSRVLLQHMNGGFI